MSIKGPRWRPHILMSKKAAFRAKDRELMLKGFEIDLDYELGRAKKSHWIEVKCYWRNVGCRG
jgi:hypothetical protein